MTEVAKLITLARYLARRKLKEALQANGIRPQTLEPSEMNRAIDALLIARRAELIAEAKAVLCKSYK
jgi:hypothetical protein